MIFENLIAALTREHGGWQQACLRTSGERSRVQCLVPARPARRDKVLDEVSAAIPGDASRREQAHGQPTGKAWRIFPQVMRNILIFLLIYTNFLG